MPTLQMLHAFAVILHSVPTLQTICESMAPNLLVAYETASKQLLFAGRNRDVGATTYWIGPIALSTAASKLPDRINRSTASK